MMKIGLTSISFRKLGVDTIIKACTNAGVSGVEWGGDIHVPHGSLQIARDVKEKTLAAGLEVSSYGSYYYVGISKQQGLPFEAVLSSAKELGAPIIRVWAGNKDFEACTEAELYMIVQETRRIADIAQKEAINISFEYHAKTLTNSNENAIKFARMVNHKNVNFYWQPSIGKDVDYCKDGLSKLIENRLLTNVHIFHWTLKNGIITRCLLEDGFDVWKEYLNILKIDVQQRYIMFEFFKGDSLNSFYKDVNTLKKLIEF